MVPDILSSLKYDQILHHKSNSHDKSLSVATQLVLLQLLLTLRSVERMADYVAACRWFFFRPAGKQFQHDINLVTESCRKEIERTA